MQVVLKSHTFDFYRNSCPPMNGCYRMQTFEQLQRVRLVPHTAQAGKGVICFSPLAQGLLTDRYLGGIPQDSRAARNATLKQTKLGDDTLACIRGLNDLAAARGQTLAEMALAWVLRGKAVTSVLVGASSPAQLLDNLGALRNTAFTAEELAAIDRLSDGIEY